MKRPISVGEAAEILGISTTAVQKRIAAGTLPARALSRKAMLVCHEAVLGEPYSESEFDRECKKYVSVPEACEIVCVTDGMVLRMLETGILKGFRVNGNGWAVEKRSAEKNIEDYLSSPASYVGRKRDLSRSRKPAKRKKSA
jgi:excisionase family DNA binding protein